MLAISWGWTLSLGACIRVSGSSTPHQDDLRVGVGVGEYVTQWDRARHLPPWPLRRPHRGHRHRDRGRGQTAEQHQPRTANRLLKRPASISVGLASRLFTNDLAGVDRQGGPTMCRWLAYSGSRILLEELLYKPAYSLIDQSIHSRLGATTTNGDGFGVGWYVDDPPPDVFRAVGPAWSDRNLRELAGHVARHCSWSTSAPPPAWLSSRPIATPSATDAVCESTTAWSTTHPQRSPRWSARRDHCPALRHPRPAADDHRDQPTGSECGRRATPASRARSLFYSTKVHALRQLYPACAKSPKRPGWSRPSRSATSPAPGTRCPSPATVRPRSFTGRASNSRALTH
jgi:hypothetical protein